MLRGVAMLLAFSLLSTSVLADSTPTVQPAPEKKTASYRSGYQDGCSHATFGQPRNEAVFTSDAAYRDGWISGYSKCRGIGPMQNTGKPAGDINSIF